MPVTAVTGKHKCVCASVIDREQRAESREQRAESREQRAESREQRAEQLQLWEYATKRNKTHPAADTGASSSGVKQRRIETVLSTQKPLLSHGWPSVS
jgi:hypothetical protein